MDVATCAGVRKGMVGKMKKFSIIWAGELISNIGSGMTAFALSVYVYRLTESVSFVSLVTLLAYLPTILLSPVGGVLADRYDRRFLMILGDLCSGLGLLYILISIQSGSRSIAPVLIGVTVNAVFIALLEPSYKATVTDLLTEEEYAKASGMVQIAGNARYLISPALAGILLGFADIRLILLIDIGTFFLTVSTVTAVRKTLRKPLTREKTRGMIKELKEGFLLIVRNGGIMALVVIMALICFFAGFIQILTPPMLLAISDAKTVGILASVSAVGLLISSVIIGVFGIQKRQADVLFLSAAASGVFMALTGVSINLFFVGTALFLFFFSIPLINTCADVLLRVSIPHELQGRVWGMVSLLTQAGTVLAYAISGVLADRVFEPLLGEEGLLSDSVGKIIGTGQGRGVGFLLVLSGLGMVLAAVTAGRSRKLRTIRISGGSAYVSENIKE